MSVRAEGLASTLTEVEIQLKLIYLVGIWVEALLYGLYLCLFIAALNVFSRKDVQKPFASKVFLAGNVIMFLAISFHNALGVYRLVIGFAYQPDARSPLLYLNALNNWTSLASPVLLAIILWIGDALVIYRCFLIWQRRYLVVALPSFIYLVTIAVQLVNLWWVFRQVSMVQIVSRRWPVLQTTFPLYFAQNVITTSLILFKIWTRHRESKAAGVVSINTPCLVALMRAIVESAAIYTAGMLVMVILRARDHPGRYVVHAMLYPTAGIMFVLMAIRVHVVQEEAKRAPASPSLMPSWIVSNHGQAASQAHRDAQASNSSTSVKDDVDDSRLPFQVVSLQQTTSGEKYKEAMANS